MKKCIRFKNTKAGRKCAAFSEDEGVSTDHSMVEVSLKGYGVMNKSVNSTDVLIGGLIGGAGASLAKAIVNKMEETKPGGVPDLAKRLLPLIGAAGAGTLAYALQSKGNKSRATGQLVGAISVGAGVTAWDALKANLPQYFGDVVSLRLSGYPGYGVFVNENTPAIGPGAMGGYGGLIVDENQRAMAGYADNPNLAALAQVSMGGDDDGIDELAG